MEGIAVAPEGVAVREWARLRSFVRVMARDRQVGHEKPLARRQRIDPAKNARDRRRLIDAEAGIVIAADISGVGERIEAAMADYRFHAEVAEPAGVKQSGSILAGAEDLRQGIAGSGGIRFALAVERRVCGAE